jgi:STE24 endopeptidase
MNEKFIFYGSIGFMTVQFLWESYLSYRQHKVYKKNKEVPKEVRAIIDEETFKKSREYGLDRSWFGMVAGLIKQCINTAFAFYWGEKYLWKAAGNLIQLFGYGAECEIVHGIAFLFLANAVSTVLDLLFSTYNNFVIEEKHGFDKQTYGFYFKDKLKKFLVSEAISLPIVASVVWIVKNGGNSCFVYLWVNVSLVSLALMIIFPDYISPSFDKYTPLPDGDLKAKIESLAARIDFPLYKLYVVEGSKRSSHCNAYFYGFLKNKQIVLFDTLLEESEAAKIREASPENEAKKKSEKQDGSGKTETKKTGCTTDEVLAVLGHELGHWKLNHVLKNIIIAEASLFLLFLVFNSLFKYKPLYVGFGFDEETPVFICLYIVMSYIVAPCNTVLNFGMTLLSRRFEFAADAFAKKLGYAENLKKGLVKLSKDNLGFPVYDWLFSSWHHSHPPLLQRIAAIDDKKESVKSD